MFSGDQSLVCEAVPCHTLFGQFSTSSCAYRLFYSFGVVLTQLVQDQCRYEAIAATGNVNAVPHCEDGVLHKYWSTIFESMLTLFMAISGGLSWGEALDPLKSFSLIAVACMVFYVLIAVFAVMNVVTRTFDSKTFRLLCACCRDFLKTLRT